MKHVLPIDQYLPEIAELLSRSPCLILEAEPGAGKSTRVPLELLKANWLLGRKIVMLEPRRLAVRSIARYLASQLGEKEGQTIGYSIKNESRISKDTRLEIVTEGILLRRLQRDPELEDTALIIFDEFHERSLQADLALALSQYVQNILRDDLKILVMSATMDSQTISQKLNNAPIIQCAGRNFPVDCFYESNTVGQNLNLRIKNAVFHALESQAGDILVFLPGMKEIKQVTELLTESLMSRDILLCPLYGGLNNEEQDQAIRPSVSGKRKIVLATNIAETSLTIEGIGCVVDGGLHRRARFNPKSGMTQLVTETISRASAEQRKGRAGRLAAGSCYRIWTESQQNMLIAQQPEEILVADLADLSLELAAWSIQDTTDLSWITPPPAPHLSQARDLLQQLELLDQQNQITRIGTEALRLGVHPRLARMLLKSRDWNLGYLACDLAALLAERDLFRRDSNGSSDLTLRLIALQHYRSNRKEALARYPMIRNAAEQALINSKNWQRLLGLKTSPIDSRNDNIYRQSGRLLAQAYPDRVARLRQNSDTRYLLRNGKGAKLWNDDSLCSEPWIICTELDGKHQESQIYLAATIEQADIETDFTGQITDKESVHLKAGNSKPTATKETCLGAIVLKSTHIREPSSEAIGKSVV